MVKEDKQLVAVDCQPGPECDGVAAAVFSADGKRVAYPAQQGDKWLVVVDGRLGPEFDVIQGVPVFRNGASIEYLAMRSDSLFRVRQ